MPIPPGSKKSQPVPPPPPPRVAALPIKKAPVELRPLFTADDIQPEKKPFTPAPTEKFRPWRSIYVLRFLPWARIFLFVAISVVMLSGYRGYFWSNHVRYEKEYTLTPYADAENDINALAQFKTAPEIKLAAAIKRLGERSYPDILPFALKNLHHPASSVRESIAYALRFAEKSEESFAALLTLAADGTDSVATSALESLLTEKSEPALVKFAQWTQQRLPRYPKNTQARVLALKTVAKLGTTPEDKAKGIAGIIDETHAPSEQTQLQAIFALIELAAIQPQLQKVLATFQTSFPRVAQTLENWRTHEMNRVPASNGK